MELLGSHDCEASIKKTLVCNYFTGLMPSESGNPGLDVLNISLHKDGAKYFLKFRTHRRTTESIGPGVHATHANCQDREVTDELASRYGSGAYFNIKWLRCSYGKSKNAILEIYSWYGILGTRLFAPKNNNGWEYSLVGQQPYMGQTSLGMGLGCEGDWGYGFMTWGPNEDWVDSNVWHLKPDGSNGEGNWGMTKEDYNRETVHGWEVRKRPKPVLA